MPQRNGFFREEQKPKASVQVTLHPGRTLDRAQLRRHRAPGVVSVPDLDAKEVSVVDGSGTLLTACRTAARARAWTRCNCNTRATDRVRPAEERGGPARTRGRPRTPARHHHRRCRLLRDASGVRGIQAEPGHGAGHGEGAADARIHPARRGRAQRCARRAEQPSRPRRPQRRHPAHAAPLGCPGWHGRQRQQPAQSTTNFEVDKTQRTTRSDHRYGQAPVGRGGGEPPRQHRPQGQGDEHATHHRGSGKTHRPGAAGHRLQQIAATP